MVSGKEQQEEGQENVKVTAPLLYGVSKNAPIEMEILYGWRP